MKEITLTFKIEDEDFKAEFKNSDTECEAVLEDWVFKVGGYDPKIKIEKR